MVAPGRDDTEDTNIIMKIYNMDNGEFRLLSKCHTEQSIDSLKKEGCYNA